MTEQATNTSYHLLRHHPGGEVYAVRWNETASAITGITGPLDEEEQHGDANSYDFDDQPEDVEWANKIDRNSDLLTFGESWHLVRSL